MITLRTFGCTAALCGFLASGLAAPMPDLERAVAAIRAVGPEGRGNVEAARAWAELARVEPSQLPALLAGFDGANELAANWLRAAVQTVVDRAQREKQPLPVVEIGQFLLELRHNPQARQLAFELVSSADSDLSQRLLAGMLQDPCLELRREAVQRLIAEADTLLTAGNRTGSILLQRQALGCARDVDQVENLAKKLRGLGQTVDLSRLFGWVTNWRIIGPFDNSGGTGYGGVAPPEQIVDLLAEYDGKAGKVRWTNIVAKNEYGLVDANRVYGKLKGATAYCYTEFVSDKAQPVELRLGCKNAWKVWLNGRLLFGRDEYHRGMQIDQYRMPAELRAGRNTILVKLCQNEQTEDWTVEWEFQLRVTDSMGTPILPAPLPAVVAPASEANHAERRAP